MQERAVLNLQIRKVEKAVNKIAPANPREDDSSLPSLESTATRCMLLIDAKVAAINRKIRECRDNLDCLNSVESIILK